MFYMAETRTTLKRSTHKLNLPGKKHLNDNQRVINNQNQKLLKVIPCYADSRPRGT
jgi:hypothetical protein